MEITSEANKLQAKVNLKYDEILLVTKSLILITVIMACYSSDVYTGICWHHAFKTYPVSAGSGSVV